MIRAAGILIALSGSTLLGAVTEESIKHAGVRFRVVRAEPEQVQIVWKGADGAPYRTFDRVQAAFSKQGKTVTFLMNAGIFEPGGIPTGMHVENRRELHALNLADAPGNFFLKPNGVLWIETGDSKYEAFIAPTGAFRNRDAALKQRPRPQVEHAVQSGPLLLIDGKRHPAFRNGSPNKLHRNGVGVDSRGRLVFAITDKGQLVNFWDFAGLFLKLDCRNALFLDGDISQSAANPPDPVESNRFGAMFVITE